METPPEARASARAPPHFLLQNPESKFRAELPPFPPCIAISAELGEKDESKAAEETGEIFGCRDDTNAGGLQMGPIMAAIKYREPCQSD